MRNPPTIEAGYLELDIQLELVHLKKLLQL